MNLELISQMVGGLEGLQTALTPFYPKLEQAIKEGLTAKRAEFSEMMKKENFTLREKETGQRLFLVF